MILTYEPTEVGCIIKARPIGVLIMEDEEGEDPKILSVPVKDPRFDGIHEIIDVHPHKLREIQEFFEVYKRLEPRKWVKFKAWKNSQEAKKVINYSIDLYKKKYSS